MKKSIYQLKKLASRCKRRSSASLHALTKDKSANPDSKPWKNNTGVNIGFQRARIAVCAAALTSIKKELLSRCVGLPPARPPKVKYPRLPVLDIATA